MNPFLYKALKPFQKKARKPRNQKLRRQLEQKYIARNQSGMFRDNLSF